ncbi:uncharacterized protein BDW47DRAFT_72303 [Aspergillus candidus]|uniref:Uncharacterized protein n=1 Tax=Aspergillus candidus TaxID=41067 RepID=A0A2I2F254_ASPCN|nr:hypothetical protein BDW47DRAFT_72303 [Aspergillus candidus]PLB34697.1 hypothetical protein BDW47DRAFT_72303 [Aspergillus candidus]
MIEGGIFDSFFFFTSHLSIQAHVFYVYFFLLLLLCYLAYGLSLVFMFHANATESHDLEQLFFFPIFTHLLDDASGRKHCDRFTITF